MDQSDTLKRETLDALLAAINEFTASNYVPGDVDLTSPLFDYGVDSLNVLQILAAVGDAVGIEIDLGALSESAVASIAALVEYVDSLRASAAESV